MRQALEMALEALEKERINYQGWDKEDGAPEYIHEAMNAIESALAQPEPEPVAWRHKQFFETQEGWFYADWHSNGINPPNAELLYTTPPQPKEPEQETLALEFEKMTGVPDAWNNPALMQVRNGFIGGWEAAHGIKE